MKLTDFLEDIGRPIAYYPSMRKITGSTNATVLLCQFIYWRGKEADPNGWLLKTSEEIEGETGLSYDEQKTARKQLKDAGFLEEHYARLDHQMKFRLDLDAINEAWAPWQKPVPEHGNATMGKVASGDSLNSNTETTTENIGTDVPEGFGLDWQVAAGKKITQQDQFVAQAKDAANLIETGCLGAGGLALAFMTARHLIIPESKIKGNRKAAREMLEMHVKPEHVKQATLELIAKGMTVTDLFSVSKTAIDLANPSKPATTDRTGMLRTITQ